MLKILVETFHTPWSPKVGSNILFLILWLSQLGQYKSYRPSPTCTRTCWVSGRRLHLTTRLHCYFNFLVPQVLSHHFPPTARSFATKWAQLTAPRAAIQRKRKAGGNYYNLSCLRQLLLCHLTQLEGKLEISQKATFKNNVFFFFCQLNLSVLKNLTIDKVYLFFFSSSPSHPS